MNKSVFVTRFRPRVYAGILIGLFSLHNLNAQLEEKKLSPAQQAEAYLQDGNFDEALDLYLDLAAEDPKNEKYPYNIAVCYLNLTGNKAKAIPYLEKSAHLPKHDPNTYYLLGRAYHYANRFDEAITNYKKFKQEAKGSPENLKNTDKQIEYCLNAKELMKYPVDVSFENLGANVNSGFDEHFPFVTTDESFIIFNTNRPEKNAEKEADGNYKNAIFISEVKDGKFQKAQILGAPISSGNTGTEIVGMSADGKTILLYIKKGESGDLYISEKDDKGSYGAPVLLDKNINSSNDEIAASISSDGQQLFFASNRPGGIGGTDIYMAQRLPTGKWSVPVNLGPNVNTPENEDFPNISEDGQSLFFSSMGHTSMGGYDIFKAILNPETNKWENCTNIGFPINTTDDNLNFRLSKSGRYGYFSTYRDRGLGEMDNYRVTFNQIEKELSVIHGKVISEDGSQLNYPDVLISVTDEKTKELVGTYLPNPYTGKYVIIVPPGKYDVQVDLFNFNLLSKKIEVLDKSSFRAEIDLDLKLQTQK